MLVKKVIDIIDMLCIPMPVALLPLVIDEPVIIVADRRRTCR